MYIYIYIYGVGRLNKVLPYGIAASSEMTPGTYETKEVIPITRHIVMIARHLVVFGSARGLAANILPRKKHDYIKHKCKYKKCGCVELSSWQYVNVSILLNGFLENEVRRCHALRDQ